MTYPAEEFSAVTFGVLTKGNVRVNISCNTENSRAPIHTLYSQVPIWQIKREAAMSSCRRGSQQYQGCARQSITSRLGQELLPLCSAPEDTPRVLGPVLVPSMRHGRTGGSPVKGHEDDWGSKAPKHTSRSWELGLLSPKERRFGGRGLHQVVMSTWGGQWRRQSHDPLSGAH